MSLSAERICDSRAVKLASRTLAIAGIVTMVLTVMGISTGVAHSRLGAQGTRNGGAANPS